MSVKKIVLMTAASVAVLTAGVSFAGGSYAAPVASNSGVYVDVTAGAFLRDIKDNSSLSQDGTTLATYDNGQSGFTVGGNLGYQFNKTWSVEVGYDWLQNAKVTASGAAIFTGGSALASGDIVTVKTWMMDAALKASVPVMDCVSAFAKLGAAYTHNEVDLNDAGTHYKKDNNYWNPMFGAGLDYNVNQTWTVGVEYTYVPGGDTWAKVHASPILPGTRAGSHVLPGIHALKLKVGYTFAM